MSEVGDLAICILLLKSRFWNQGRLFGRLIMMYGSHYAGSLELPCWVLAL